MYLSVQVLRVDGARETVGTWTDLATLAVTCRACLEREVQVDSCRAAASGAPIDALSPGNDNFPKSRDSQFNGHSSCWCGVQRCVTDDH